MWGEFYAALGGTAVALGLGLLALKKLSSWFVEHRLKVALQAHQHGLNTNLKQFEADLSRMSDVLSRRNEREFQVVEEAWDLMIRAVGDCQQKYSALREFYDFEHIDESKAVEIVSGRPFSNEEKALILSVAGKDRTELYARINDWYEGRESEAEWGEFKNWLSLRQIFIVPRIYRGFKEIEDDLNGIIATVTAYSSHREKLPSKVRMELGKKLREEIEPKLDRLAVVIQKRFGLDETDWA